MVKIRQSFDINSIWKEINRREDKDTAMNHHNENEARIRQLDNNVLLIAGDIEKF